MMSIGLLKKYAIILISALVFGLGNNAVFSADNPKIKEAMHAMKEDAAKLGKPKLEGDTLFFGSTKINDNYTLVDELKAKYGCTATFFAKKGSAFIRVSTNVMKDGKRAVGTPLDPAGPANAANQKGNPFYGMVDILGKIYDTGYEPIKNAAGEVIGIYYIGFSME